VCGGQYDHTATPRESRTCAKLTRCKGNADDTRKLFKKIPVRPDGELVEPSKDRTGGTVRLWFDRLTTNGNLQYFHFLPEPFSKFLNGRMCVKVVIPNEERDLRSCERTERFLAMLEMTNLVAYNREQ